MAMPAKKYFSLRELADSWGATSEDVEYSVVHDGLKTCCWLDRREAVLFQPACDGLPRSGHYEYELVEGYVGVQATDCRKIFRVGKYHITEFMLLDRPGMMIGLMGRNADAVISIACLRVKAEERERFEQLFSLNSKPPENNAQRESGLIISIDVQDCIFNGKPMQLGAIQFNVIRMLVEARRSGEQWMHSKTLLNESGSKAERIRDVFKTQPYFAEVVETNQRGKYRIRPDIAVRAA